MRIVYILGFCGLLAACNPIVHNCDENFDATIAALDARIAAADAERKTVLVGPIYTNGSTSIAVCRNLGKIIECVVPTGETITDVAATENPNPNIRHAALVAQKQAVLQRVMSCSRA